ncbi:hypothetical protein SPRG_00441 [Saprolegnia parasitica CBS 223.65]|uniref:Imidazole glycerol phosphate synthase hisHF n=1 Tax=Saprolegnia parasitica (strain CBS 223.65) TaxID=695850 RepID=A0A067CY17_SAPPC|nr:hypothetical protein SPRG_00441 [Saprolegnia parasitica CBS 223.65]KDO35599.1 hypothetical protein SPRG_00441 [Saprolegnia parasitica CBS 223.65]|eukprot:XP_012193930.1 hypothetical protein SPRG_00441 [Saprolegnia parasitica CBS 223.65]
MTAQTTTTKTVTVLDYGAGNVRSLTNALHALGYEATFVTCVEDIAAANVLLFPGVGNFQQAMHFLNANAYVDALRAYICANKRFLGICLGMQTLFEGSEECPGVNGLGVVPGIVTKFPTNALAVPHIGWNGVNARKASPLFSQLANDANVYFVHSFRATPTDANRDWVLTTTNYGDVEFISAIQHGNVMATQFHPEKSGAVGLQMLRGFLEGDASVAPILPLRPFGRRRRRLRCASDCLDVRSNDHGDLVVTKGDQYDVREASDGGNVRNMGKPVELCTRYYNEGADEVAFLNITSFREQPLGDTPMLAVLEASSKEVFVPLTVGGGIRGYTDDSGRTWSALDVAARYFRAGADKVSIGSDAVDAAEGYYAANKVLSKSTSIEQISTVYGRQAVVISVDPRRVYVPSQADTRHHVLALQHQLGPNGETHCWYQVMVKGGREGRDMDVVELTQACEALGAGEILLNCVDMDGQNAGYDLDLVKLVKQSVTIPVVASSGAGKPSHFTDVFRTTNCDAALAAGIFHRQEVKISQVKDRLHADQIPVRT